MMGPRGRDRLGGRRAVTLVELLLSMFVMTLVFGAVASAMLLASRSVPQPGDTDELTRAGYAALTRLADELQTATVVEARSGRSIQFVMPDRNDDGSPDTVIYSWDGTPGSPLQRAVGGGPAVDVVSAVDSFDIALESVVEETELPPEEQESGTRDLLYLGDSANLATMPLTSGRAVAQYFLPDLPDEALSWQVTSIQFQASRGYGSGGTTEIQVTRLQPDGTPNPAPLATKTLHAGLLNYWYQWYDARVTTPHSIPRGEGVCIVLKYVDGGVSCYTYYHASLWGCWTGNHPPLAMAMLTSDDEDEGEDWSWSSSQGLQIIVRGTYTYLADPEIETHRYADRANLSLTPSGVAVPLLLDVHLLNAPEVADGT